MVPVRCRVSTVISVRITFELSRLRWLAKPAVAGRLQRRVGRRHARAHEGRTLHVRQPASKVPHRGCSLTNGTTTRAGCERALPKERNGRARRRLCRWPTMEVGRKRMSGMNTFEERCRAEVLQAEQPREACQEPQWRCDQRRPNRTALDWRRTSQCHDEGSPGRKRRAQDEGFALGRDVPR